VWSLLPYVQGRSPGFTGVGVNCGVKPGKQTLSCQGISFAKQVMLAILATIMADVKWERLAILNRFRRAPEMVAGAVVTLGDYLSGVVILRLCWPPR
jgi:hypothetical protein